MVTNAMGMPLAASLSSLCSSKANQEIFAVSPRVPLCWGYFHPKHKDAKIFEKHLNPVIVVFIGLLSLSIFRWVPIYQGFSHFFNRFFALFCIGQISSSIRVWQAVQGSHRCSWTCPAVNGRWAFVINTPRILKGCLNQLICLIFWSGPGCWEEFLQLD